MLGITQNFSIRIGNDGGFNILPHTKNVTFWAYCDIDEKNKSYHCELKDKDRTVASKTYLGASSTVGKEVADALEQLVVQHKKF